MANDLRTAGRRVVLAVDPGRYKCGVAVVEAGDAPSATVSKTHQIRIVMTQDLISELARILRQEPKVDTIVVGDGTQGRTLRRAIVEMFPDTPVELIDERGSSQRAREKYLQMHPARGWKRLLPTGLRTPETAYDDLVAELLAKDFLIKS